MAHRDADYLHPGRCRLAGLLLVRNPDGHVLLIKTSEAGWQLPGGVACHERPDLAARRRCGEETGLTPVPGVLLLADYQPFTPVTGRADGGLIELVFDGGTLPGGTVLDPPQIPPEAISLTPGWSPPPPAQAAFAAPDQLGQMCTPYHASRIRDALSALARCGQRGYRVKGEPVAPARPGARKKTHGTPEPRP